MHLIFSAENSWQPNAPVEVVVNKTTHASRYIYSTQLQCHLGAHLRETMWLKKARKAESCNFPTETANFQ